MKVKDLVFEQRGSEDDNLFWVIDSFGRITILDRLTGWGDGDVRDVETGYKDPQGKFWLASGSFDIREFPDKTIEEAIQFIKDNANTCNGI